MGYCKDCKVLFSPEVSVCSYCEPGDLVANPPELTQGEVVELPDIPGIVEGQEIGGALEAKAIEYYIDQSGATTNMAVGSEKYDQAKEIQEQVLGK